MAKTEFLLTPVVGNNFVGRKDIIGELYEELGDEKSHIGFCLYGMRRVGKTSVLMELKRLLDKKRNLVVPYMSLYDIADLSLKTFGEELFNIIISAYQEKGLLPLKIKIRKLLDTPIDIVIELLKNAKVEASITERIKIIFEYRENSKNHSEYVREVFNIAEMLAKSTGTKSILMLDEFPEILKIENGIQLVKMLRTQYELQKRTAIVISGSIKKTLEIVALSEASPFYKQLIPKHLLPFTEKETAEFIKLYLRKANKTDIKSLHELTGGLPFYLQFIGRSTTYSGDIESSIRTFVNQEGDAFFKEEFEKLSDKEKLIAISISRGNKKLKDIAKHMNEPATTVGRYIPLLIEKDIINKESRGNYILLDNLFGFWLRQKYNSN